ncbi:Nn.00g043690.m01.CDS01 [Neocucurbitaria sp. VM-36]
MEAQYHSSPLPKGLRYYLLRGSVMVPLVPVDQLPFQLHGVPRQLSHRQMSEEGWKYFAETDEVPSAISIQSPMATLSPQSAVKAPFLAPDHHVRYDSQTTQEGTSRTSRLSLTAAENVLELPRSTAVADPQHRPSLIDAFASIYQTDAQRLEYRMPYPSGIEPDPSKKEYCTHWIKTGECAFTSIGCKFKHEMPTTEKLRELGFSQGMPRWWKEKSAIATRGPTWMQRRLAHGNEDEEAPTMRHFPDPSTLRNRHTEARNVVKDSVQHHAEKLRKEATTGPTMTQRNTLPAAPMQISPQPASRVSNLLIDLDETPAPPPPSLQPSDSSSAGDASSDTQSLSNRTPVLFSKSPVSQCTLSPVVNGRVSKTEVTQKAEKPTTRPCARRNSQISWTSVSSEEEVSLAKSLLNKRKSNPRKSTRLPSAPAKQHGLANSKHATNTHANNPETTGRHDTRRKARQKQNGIAAPELHAKIEQLRRGVQQKEKARKGAAIIETQVRAGVRMISPISQQQLS